MRFVMSLASLVLVVLVVACGGKTSGSAASDAGRDAPSAPPPDASGDAGGDAYVCATLAIQPGDLDCVSDTDCTGALLGTRCANTCPCGIAQAANQAAAARIANETPPFTGPGCGCASTLGIARCLGTQCVYCTSPSDPACIRPPGPPDAGFDAAVATKVDGGTCVNVDVATYDTSCVTAADCILIFTGELCVPSSCPCQQDYVNIGEQARYDQAYNQLPPSACSCPTAAGPQCVGGACLQLR